MMHVFLIHKYKFRAYVNIKCQRKIAGVEIFHDRMPLLHRTSYIAFYLYRVFNMFMIYKLVTMANEI